MKFPPASDPRIAELRQLRLGPAWLGVADLIGFDQFVAVWRLLTSSEAWLDERNRISLPSFKQYLRLQRNLLIKSMLERGHTTAEIRAHVRAALGEDMDLSHLLKIIAKMRVKE